MKGLTKSGGFIVCLVGFGIIQVQAGGSGSKSQATSSSTYESSNFVVTGIKSFRLGQPNSSSGLRPITAIGNLQATLKNQNAVVNALKLDGNVSQATRSLTNAQLSGGVSAVFSGVEGSKTTIESSEIFYKNLSTKSTSSAEVSSKTPLTFNNDGSAVNGNKYSHGTLQADSGDFFLDKSNSSSKSLVLSRGLLNGNVQFTYESASAPTAAGSKPVQTKITGHANQLKIDRETSGNYQLTLLGNVIVEGTEGAFGGNSTTETLIMELTPDLHLVEFHTEDTAGGKLFLNAPASAPSPAKKGSKGK